MQITEVSFPDQPPVYSYGPGFFRVGGVVIDGPILLTRDGLLPWAGTGDPAPLAALAGKVDILFLGMGAEIRPVPAALQQALDRADIPYEPMGSAPACRTYNVLLSENRRVALAALPV